MARHEDPRLRILTSDPADKLLCFDQAAATLDIDIEASGDRPSVVSADAAREFESAVKPTRPLTRRNIGVALGLSHVGILFRGSISAQFLEGPSARRYFRASS